MRTFLFFTCILFFIFSCGNDGNKSNLTIHWSSSIDSLFHDSLPGKRVLDSLRKEVLKAENDTDEINRANIFAEALPTEQMHLLTNETAVQSKKLNYRYGILLSLYHKGFYSYRKGNYDSAIIYVDSCHALAKKNKIVRLQTKCLEKLGDAYYMQDNYEKAYDNFEQALILATVNKDKNAQAFSLCHIGELYRMQNDYAKAIDYFGKSIDLATKINDKDIVSYATGAMGDIYRAEGNFSKALEYYQNELLFAKEKGDKYEIGFALSSLADANRLNANYSSAIDYYNQALLLFQGVDDKTDIAYCLSSLADVYQRLNDSKNAISYAQQALAYSMQMKDNLSIDDCLSTIGDIYEQNNSFDSANYYLNKAIENSLKIKDNGNVAFATRRIAHMYFHQGKMADAIREGEKSMVISRESKVQTNVKGSAELLYQIYRKTGDYKKAFEMHLLYTNLKDSLLSSDQVKKFAAVELKSRENEMKADQAQKEVEFKAAQIKKEDELKRQKTIGYAVTGGLVLVLLLALVIFRSLQQNKKAKKIIEHQKELVEEKQKEVMDSIRYAKRIQQSLLPTEKYIDKSLNRLRDKRS